MRVFYYDKNGVCTGSGTSADVPEMATEIAPNTPEDVFNGEEWVTPVLTQEEVLLGKRQAIQEEKRRIRDAGVIVNGILFDTDESARLAYIEVAFELMSNPEYSVTWKASAGVFTTMDAATFAALKLAGKELLTQVHVWQAARETELKAAKTIEEIHAVGAAYAADEKSI